MIATRALLFLLRYLFARLNDIPRRMNGTFVQRERERAGTKAKLYHGSVILGLTLDGESRFCLRSIQFERSELQILTDCPRAYYRTLPARNIGRNCCFRTHSAPSFRDIDFFSFLFSFRSYLFTFRENIPEISSISRSSKPSLSTHDRSYLILKLSIRIHQLSRGEIRNSIRRNL